MVGLTVSWVGARVTSVADGSDGCGVGLDVESPDARALLARLEPTLLGPPEAAALADHDQDRPAALLRRWVAKEAALEAAGVGLRVDPRELELLDDGHALRVRHWPVEVVPALVHLVDLDPPAPGHVAVLAMIAEAPPLVRERLAPGLREG